MLVFSTHQWDAEAFARWRAAICQHFVPLRPEPSAACGECFGELRSWHVDILTLSTIRASGQRIHRDSREIARSDGEAFFLTVQVSGETGIVCGERSGLARPGDMYLLDARRPFTLHCGPLGRGVSLTLPRSVCAGPLSRLDTMHGLVRSPGDAVSNLLGDYLCSLARMDGEIGSTESEDIADHVISLLGHAFVRNESTACPPHRATHAALLARARKAIERRLCDPDLEPASLARDTGVSLRQLQVLFAEHDTSPMRAVLERRIALASKMLQQPAYAGKSITQIAFDCGFRDLSHFGRSFAAATGVTPRAWRRNGANSGSRE